MTKLTLEEFVRLSEEERCERYVGLSDHDKFLARISAPGGLTKIDASQKSLPEAKKEAKDDKRRS